MNKTLFGVINISYLIKFFLIFLGLYYFNIYMIGITTPGGAYYPFVADHLNYPVWIRTFILFCSEQVTHLFGYPSHLVGEYLFNDDRSKSLMMGWPCYGLGLMSFWFAFVISDSGLLRHRLKWVAIGLATINIINISRISLLYISILDNWSIGQQFASTNHDVFNYASYVVIAILMLLYKNKGPKEPAPPVQGTPALA